MPNKCVGRNKRLRLDIFLDEKKNRDIWNFLSFNQELKYQSKIGSFYAALKLQNFLNNVFKYRSKYAKNEDGQFEENL